MSATTRSIKSSRKRDELDSKNCEHTMPMGVTEDFLGAKEPDQMLHWYASEVIEQWRSVLTEASNDGEP